MGTIKEAVATGGTFLGGTVTQTVQDGIQGAKLGFKIPAVLGGIATVATAALVGTLGWAAVPAAALAYGLGILPSTIGGFFGKGVTMAVGLGAVVLFGSAFPAIALGLGVAALTGAVSTFTTLFGAKLGGAIGFLRGGTKAVLERGETQTVDLQQELVTARHKRMQAEQNFEQTQAQIEKLQSLPYMDMTERQLPKDQAMTEVQNAYNGFNNPDAKGNGYHAGYVTGRREQGADHLEGAKAR